MSGLETARNRLEAAIDRLESAMASRPASLDASAELDALRRDCEALRSRQANAANRLDGLIARLRRKLGEQG